MVYSRYVQCIRNGNGNGKRQHQNYKNRYIQDKISPTTHTKTLNMNTKHEMQYEIIMCGVCRLGVTNNKHRATRVPRKDFEYIFINERE